MMIKQLPLKLVLYLWRPGSFDRTWDEEFIDLLSVRRAGEFVRTLGDQHNYPAGVMLRVLRDGRSSIAPVTLGWDSGSWHGKVWNGRVWSGHHRLCLWHIMGWPSIPVDVVPQGERRTGESAHCAPPEGRM